MQEKYKKLSKAIILGLLLSMPYDVRAAEYTDVISGSDDKYDTIPDTENPIRVTDGTQHTYTFNDGDVIKIVEIVDDKSG